MTSCILVTKAFVSTSYLSVADFDAATDVLEDALTTADTASLCWQQNW